MCLWSTNVGKQPFTMSSLTCGGTGLRRRLDGRWMKLILLFDINGWPVAKGGDKSCVCDASEELSYEK